MSRRTARRRMTLKAAAEKPVPAPKKAAVKPAPTAKPAAPKEVVAQPAVKAPAKKVVKKAEKKEE